MFMETQYFKDVNSALLINDLLQFLSKHHRFLLTMDLGKMTKQFMQENKERRRPETTREKT